MLTLSRLDPAPAPLLDAAAFRLFARIDHDAEDALIEDLIAAATAHLEGERGVLGGLVLMPQVWRLGLGCFPVAPIDLPLAPVIDIQSVTWLDAADLRHTIDPASYHLWRDGRRAWVKPRPGFCWPDAVEAPDSVEITFGAGFAGAAVPPPILQAARMLVAYWYENREAAVTGTISTAVRIGVDALLAQHARPGF